MTGRWGVEDDDRGLDVSCEKSVTEVYLCVRDTNEEPLLTKVCTDFMILVKLPISSTVGMVNLDYRTSRTTQVRPLDDLLDGTVGSIPIA